MVLPTISTLILVIPKFHRIPTSTMSLKWFLANTKDGMHCIRLILKLERPQQQRLMLRLKLRLSYPSRTRRKSSKLSHPRLQASSKTLLSLINWSSSKRLMLLNPRSKSLVLNKRIRMQAKILISRKPQKKLQRRSKRKMKNFKRPRLFSSQPRATWPRWIRPLKLLRMQLKMKRLLWPQPKRLLMLKLRSLKKCLQR